MNYIMKMGVSCPAENEDSLASQPKQHLIIPMSQTRNKSRNKIFFFDVYETLYGTL